MRRKEEEDQTRLKQRSKRGRNRLGISSPSRVGEYKGVLHLFGVQGVLTRAPGHVPQKKGDTEQSTPFQEKALIEDGHPIVSLMIPVTFANYTRSVIQGTREKDVIKK